jgi:hypothetical protein
MRFLRLSVLSLAITACALNPAPVPIVGDSWGIADMAGEWIGDYRGPERSGTIVFRLEAGHDTAFGDVVMAPRLTLGRTDPEVHSTYLPRDTPRTLFIRFVRVEDNQVSGIMEPYRSPDCGCVLSTAFTGVRRGNRIQGTFVTHHSECSMPPERGTWWAER